MNHQSFICERFEYALQQKIEVTHYRIERRNQFYEFIAHLRYESFNRMVRNDGNTKQISAEDVMNDGFTLLQRVTTRVKQENEREQRRVQFEREVAKARHRGKGLLPLEQETNFGKAAAAVIKMNMTIQSTLIEIFFNFMQQTISINRELIRQQTMLFELGSICVDKADYFLNVADSIIVFNAEKLIDIGCEKLKYLNSQHNEEVKRCELQLEALVGSVDRHISQYQKPSIEPPNNEEQ